MPVIPKGQISFIVGNIHVGTRDTAVVREFYRRFKQACVKDEHLTMGAIPLFSRAFRKRCYRYALKVHHKNQDLCRRFRL